MLYEKGLDLGAEPPRIKNLYLKFALRLVQLVVVLTNIGS